MDSIRPLQATASADLTFSKSFEKVQQLSGVSLSSFVATVSTSLAIFAGEVFLFLILRKRLPSIYPAYSRTYRHSWLSIAHGSFAITNGSQMDEYFFQRYLRTLLLIFAPAAFTITPILIPINYIHGKSIEHGVSGLDTLGWSNVGLNHTDRYWSHLSLAVLFVAHICRIIWSELTAYVAIQQGSPHMNRRTVLIDSIPEKWLSEEGLRRQLRLFPGKITTITFNRDLSSLAKQVQTRHSLLHALEVAETNLIRSMVKSNISDSAERNTRNSDRERIRPPLPFLDPTSLLRWFYKERIDAITFYRKELRKIIVDIEQSRKSPDRFDSLSSAFVTFDDPVAAHMVCQTVIHPKPGYMTPRTLPLSVEDIVWDNVSIGWWERSVRTVVSNTSIAIISVMYVVPVAFAGLLSQIIYLTRAVTWLSWISTLPSWSLGVIQGILPPVMIAILLRGFSISLQFLVRIQGASSKSLIDLKVQSFYFFFLLIQVTLVISLSAGLTTIVDEISDGGSVTTTLAKNLPKASNYYLSYVLLQSLSVSANALLRVDVLAGNFVLGPIFDQTVTQRLDRKKGQELCWGTFVPVYTNLACIGILYAIISPIIIPFQVLIFALFWLIYAQTSILQREFDRGGIFYPDALKHLIYGLYMMETGLLSLFLLVRDERGNAGCIGQACFIVATIVLTAVFHHLVHKAFDPLIHYSPTSTQAPVSDPDTRNLHFEYSSIDKAPIIRLPIDPLGHSLRESSELRRVLEGIEISISDATMNLQGMIKLKKVDGGASFVPTA